MTNDFNAYLKDRAKLVEKNLAKYVGKIENSPKVLTDSMAYSLQAGGKRVRPILLMATAYVNKASPANRAKSSPNTLWLVGLPRRRESLSIEGRSS